MEHIVGILIVFFVVEVFALFIFSILNFIYIKKGPETPSPKKKNRIMGMAKGSLERACLFFSLYLGFPQMLIAFGALKVGTKLGIDKDCQISNDYYLVGNLVSIFLAFLTYFLCRDCFHYIVICS